METATMQAYKRSPALDNSTWYKGLLISQLAGGSDNDGAFDLVESKMTKAPNRLRTFMVGKMNFSISLPARSRCLLMAGF